eukprot:1736470-Pyramimonas_sp.AAC.1
MLMQFTGMRAEGICGAIKSGDPDGELPYGPAVSPSGAAKSLGLDTAAVESTIKTLSSHLVTLERIQFSRQFYHCQL